MFTLDCDRAYLYAHPERELTPDETQRYDEALARRATGVPAQYITGHQEFWGLDLIVSPAVLIPRPETEHVVETVLELARVGQSSKCKINSCGRGHAHAAPHTSCASLTWVLALERLRWRWRRSCHGGNPRNRHFWRSARSRSSQCRASRSCFENRLSPGRFAGGILSRFVRHRGFESSLRRRVGRRFGAARSAQVRAAQCGFCGANRNGSDRAADSSGARGATSGRMAGIRNQRDDCGSRARIAVGLGRGRDQKRFTGNCAGRDCSGGFTQSLVRCAPAWIAK